MVRNSNDLFLSQDDRETQMANLRQIQQEARDEGNHSLERDATQRLDRVMDNYTQEQSVRGGS